MAKNKKVLLLVEDNPLLVGLYKTAFEKQGLEVLFAHNGASGLDLAEKNKPDAILLDILMPGMNGFEFLEKIKKNPATKDIKVIVLTILKKEEAEAKARKLGAVDYLVKSDLEVGEIVKKVLVQI